MASTPDQDQSAVIPNEQARLQKFRAKEIARMEKFQRKYPNRETHPYRFLDGVADLLVTGIQSTTYAPEMEHLRQEGIQQVDIAQDYCNQDGIIHSSRVQNILNRIQGGQTSEQCMAELPKLVAEVQSVIDESGYPHPKTQVFYERMLMYLTQYRMIPGESDDENGAFIDMNPTLKS